MVLGPSTDGGVYLIGFSKKVFEQLSLSQLPWQTSDLLSAFLETAAQNNISTALLSLLSDIDSAKDVRFYIQAEVVNTALKQRLKALFFPFQKVFYQYFLPLTYRFCWFLYQRPPPQQGLHISIIQ